MMVLVRVVAGLSWFLTASALSIQSLPFIEIGRDISNGDTAAVRVVCEPGFLASVNAYCEIQKWENGRQVARVGVVAKEVKGVLDRFFSWRPRVILSQTDTPGDVPHMQWSIRWEERASRGWVPRENPTQEERAWGRAVLQLERELKSYFSR